MERGYGSQEGGGYGSYTGRYKNNNRYGTDPNSGYGAGGGYGSDYRASVGGPGGYGETVCDRYGSDNTTNVHDRYGSTESDRYSRTDSGGYDNNGRYGSDYAAKEGLGSRYGSTAQSNLYDAGDSKYYQGPGGGYGEMCTTPGSATANGFGGSFGSTEHYYNGSTGGGYCGSEMMRYRERERSYRRRSGCFPCFRFGN